MSRSLPPPPANFVEAKHIQWANFVESNPPFLRPKRKATGRRLQGIKYEAQVQQMLCSSFPENYLPSPWLKFESQAGIKWCQPDGIMFDLEAGVVTIVEVKYQHTTDAWWQLRRLYEPVLRSMFPPHLWVFSVIEVVKWYDPLVPWPEGIRMLDHLQTNSRIPAGMTGLHIWKP